jgi:peptidoglycan/xylan/chitin deacetylase (PgdA/CDA1 family)
MKRHVLLFALAIAILQPALAETEFHGLDLGKDDSLLFSARTDLPADGNFDSLFIAGSGPGMLFGSTAATGSPAGGTASGSAAAPAISALTVYPESMVLVDGNRRLQVQNRLGIFRTDAYFHNLAPVAGCAAFAKGAAAPSGRVLPSAASPDGAWIVVSERISAAYCRLAIVETTTAKKTVVSDKVEADVENFPVRWAPDSRYFVYAKAGVLYYYSIEQHAGARVLSEDLRRIGQGSIRSARWGKDSSLFYLRGSSLYRILPAEFFPLALYRGLAGMGSLAGSLPFPYDPNFDDFWVSTDGSRIVLAKDNRNIFLLYLNPDDATGPKKVSALPYLLLQGGTTVRDVLWPLHGAVTVFTDSIAGQARRPGAYRFSAPADPTELDLTPAVKELEVAGASELVLSPDEKKVAVVTKAGIIVKAYEDWATLATIREPDALHALWIDPRNLILASAHLVESIELATGARGLVTLAQADAYGRDKDGNILASSGGLYYSLSPMIVPATSATAPAATQAGQTAAAAIWSAGGWTAEEGFGPLPAATSSDNYRVYLEPSASGAFRNLVMIRAIKAYGTATLLPPPAASYAPFPDKEEPRSGASFDHGSRIRRRELALTFDCLDSSEGLTSVLNTLREYGITATFFVNGEFVRRNPGSARLLAGSGQEVGSMFFTTVDPTDSRFNADRDYIRRGLARAEDEWYAATGHELALLWHTPFYSVNDDIISAGASMNYGCVGRDVDSLDWMTRLDAAKFPAAYLDSHSIVERIVALAKPGSIVPIRLGTPEGGRSDYLFHQLALLVNALEDSGYDIVPVSTLIEHAK